MVINRNINKINIMILSKMNSIYRITITNNKINNQFYNSNTNI